MWSRVARRARTRRLSSAGGNGDDDQFTRTVVDAVMDESRTTGMSDSEADSFTRELEQELEDANRTREISETKLRNEVKALKVLLANEREIKMEALAKIEEMNHAEGASRQDQRSRRPQTAPMRRRQVAASTFGDGHRVRPSSASRSPELRVRSRPTSATQQRKPEAVEPSMAQEHIRRLRPDELPIKGRAGFGSAVPRPTFGNYLPP